MRMGVVNKFLIASMCMWIAPVAIIYGFNHGLFPGLSSLSPESMTIVSGLLAVVSVNAVIAFYIYLAMKEPSNKHVPDAKFLADAKASVKQPVTSGTDSSSSGRSKLE